MKFEVKDSEGRKKADALVLPFYETSKGAEIAFQDKKSFQTLFRKFLQVGDFKGKESETFFLYPKEGKEPRFLLLGLGKREKLSLDVLRKAFSKAVKSCQSKKIKSLNIFFPYRSKLLPEELIEGISEGILLGNYNFYELKHDVLKENPITLLDSVTFIGIHKKHVSKVSRIQKIFSGVYFVKNLINRNAYEITPQRLASEAKNLQKSSSKIKTIVWDRKKIEREKMGFLLAVNKGSSLDPVFIICSYMGNPSSKEKIALVGKGITYDTGGLCIKPPSNMEKQRADMSGGATVLGVIKTAAALGLKKNLVGIIPSTENTIGSKSYKPGDVYKGYSGTTIEIKSTDAEGRLVLADAIAYAVSQIKPDALIDMATLTGGVIVALGEQMTGYFSNNERLSKRLKKASRNTGELVWRLPLHSGYKKLIESEIADMKNSGGREAASITSALFLEHFIKKTPWIHMDIAGSAFAGKAGGANIAGATGVGVRLLIDFLECE